MLEFWRFFAICAGDRRCRVLPEFLQVSQLAGGQCNRSGKYVLRTLITQLHLTGFSVFCSIRHLLDPGGELRKTGSCPGIQW